MTRYVFTKNNAYKARRKIGWSIIQNNGVMGKVQSDKKKEEKKGKKR